LQRGKAYDIVYVTDIATTTSGGSRFFVELAAEMSKHFRVALITGKLDEAAKTMLRGVDVYNADVYGGCELPHTCPQRLLRFAAYTLKVLRSVKFRLLHTNNHIPNLWAYLYPGRTIGTIHHLEEIPRIAPIVRIAQFLEVNAPYLLLLTPSRFLRRSRVLVVPPLLRFEPPRVSRNPEPGLVLMIGRLEERKHYDIALKALKIAKSRRPELKLVVIGDGPLRRELQELAEKLGLSGCVEFKGRVTEEEKLEYLSKAEAFLHLGHPEGFSLVTLEAALAGVPCVVHHDTPAAKLLRLKSIAAVRLESGEVVRKLIELNNRKSEAVRIDYALDLAEVYKKIYKALLSTQEQAKR
jgi:glycosyltransferase involved in cell wall biosynthesis